MRSIRVSGAATEANQKTDGEESHSYMITKDDVSTYASPPHPISDDIPLPCFGNLISHTHGLVISGHVLCVCVCVWGGGGGGGVRILCPDILL